MSRVKVTITNEAGEVLDSIVINDGGDDNDVSANIIDTLEHNFNYEEP